VSREPLFLDATMLYRWRELAPVGIVRLERLLAAHLRFRSDLGPVEYVLWDAGYRPAEPTEARLLDELLTEPERISRPFDHDDSTVGTPRVGTQRRGLRAGLRRQGLKALARFPDHLRPFAEQAAWSTATLAVESVRHVRRSHADRKKPLVRATPAGDVRHRVDFSGGGDLVALGLGWEYLDHEAMYRLKHDYGVRIHMPAFDLIPVVMPQLNVGQSDLVHRYYAEMAHYADTITCISLSTRDALRHFLEQEQLPVPVIETNQLPSFALAETEPPADRSTRRHRLVGERFVLAVSTVEIRKNHLLLAKVWAECSREGIDLPRLAIVGRIGWDVTELLRWVEHAPELNGLVTIYTDVEDSELHQMYLDALFTVFPSRVEGWGMPITESMAYGKVCVHADDPAQHEASQGLMPYLHPDDFAAWKREIVRLVTDEAHLGELETLIKQRYRPRSVDDYCERFENVVAARRGSAV
jgi:glycosyltransferase involved in cell wall biosynthesis